MNHVVRIEIGEQSCNLVAQVEKNDRQRTSIRVCPLAQIRQHSTRSVGKPHRTIHSVSEKVCSVGFRTVGQGGNEVTGDPLAVRECVSGQQGRW